MNTNTPYASYQYDKKTKILTAPKPNIEFNYKNGSGHFFWTTMKKYGDKIAQIDAVTGQRDTYSSLLQRSVRTAMELQARGIKAGDLIGVCSYNHLNSVVPYIASQLIGAIFCAIDVTIQLNDTKYLLNLVKPKLMFVSANAEKLITDACKEIQLEDMKIISFEDFDQFTAKKVGEDNFQTYIPDDCLATTNILFSSGTTGLPKGICLNHSTIISSVVFFDFIAEDENYLSYASLYWISTYFLINMAFNNGTCRLICPIFNPIDFWTYIKQYKVTYVFCDPTQIIKCLANLPIDFNYKIRYLLLAGSALSPKYFKEVRTVFSETNIMIAYAQTELGLISVLRNAGKLPEDKFRSCGFLVNGLQSKVVNTETEEPVNANEVGEIRIKLPTPMNGYYNMDSSDCWDKDGFLKTGDLGYYDQEYYFYITDRLKEMFKYLAFHIVPAKIESILVQHPDVELGIVVGVPHPEDSNHAMGIVTVKKDSKITAADIEAWMETQVDDRHKLRAGVRIVDGMLYTPTGKIKRKETRDSILKK